MEAYAECHHLTGDDVIELFHKCQVFEEIKFQHEYLHQVDFEETLEYVSKIIVEESQAKEWGHRLALRNKAKNYYL